MSLSIWLAAKAQTGHVDSEDGYEWIGFDADSHNITHNVTPMWGKAGCYEALYDSHGKRAEDVLPALRQAEEDMLRDPEGYMALEAANGWGTYSGALRFLRNVIRDFARRPLSIVRVSR